MGHEWELILLSQFWEIIFFLFYFLDIYPKQDFFIEIQEGSFFEKKWQGLSLVQRNVCFLPFSSQNSFWWRQFNRLNSPLFKTTIFLKQNEVLHHTTFVKSRCCRFYNQWKIWKTSSSKRTAVWAPGNIFKRQQTPMLASRFEHLVCASQENWNMNWNKREDAWSRPIL